MSLSILLISCETVGYYSQAARGQLEILTARKSIEELLLDPAIDDNLKSRLRLALEIKEFAIEQLDLPRSKNFDQYADVAREHVVWNVFAAPEFSTSPINWCYPIAGCVAYRGYFAEGNALKYADKLSNEGFDVYTGGVDAYSTLGWFDDPLLSTVIDRRDYQLAGLLFHELAHQVVYVEGDTTFNESFATTVEREGVKRWLQYKGSEETISIAEIGIQRQQQFVDLVIEFQDHFTGLYSQELAEEKMREEKAGLQNSLRDRYVALKKQWGDYSGYDSWFANSLNNAQLSTVSSYNDLIPFFQSELGELNGDLSAFYARVKEIAALKRTDRDELMQK